MKTSGADGKPATQQAETRLVTAGRDRDAQKGFVNPAVFHGSTVLYPTAEDLHAHRAEFTYGRPTKGHSWHAYPWAEFVRRVAAYVKKNAPDL